MMIDSIEVWWVLILVGWFIGIVMGLGNEARKVGVVRAVYSAILDENTCLACEGEDGNEYRVGTAEYMAVTPPNPNCESTDSGENFCRCLWVYEYEVAA